MKTVKTILFAAMVLWLVIITSVCIDQQNQIEAMANKDDVDTKGFVSLANQVGDVIEKITN